MRVQREGDVLARHRVSVFQHAQHAALGVGFDLLIAYVAVQLGLIEALDTGLADGLRAAVLVVEMRRFRFR